MLSIITYGIASYVPAGRIELRESSITLKFTRNSRYGLSITLFIVAAVSGLKDKTKSPDDMSLISNPE